MIAQGTRLGRYEIVSLLAAGGMGEVYRGHDSRLGRAVAIKVLPQDAFTDADSVVRFEREARAAAAVSHPNLISIHDVGSTAGLHFLVMDLLEGETLRKRLASGPLPWTETLKIAIPVVAGLAAVHEKGFVHRDLKPENIFLTSNGWVKLLDFGLAIPRVPEGPSSDDDPTLPVVTRKGMLVGTLAYMSPEQLREEEVDGRADLFAVGCVMYEMLSGEGPFRRSSRAETIAGILLGKEAPLPPSVPPGLAQIVARCLERTRERRFQSADELAAAFRVFSETGATPAEPRISAGRGPSIAVLPFANLSGEKENDYFGDGLAEEILNSLTSLSGLKVTARTSAFAFRGKQVDARTIGEALGVQTILEGGVRRAGHQVRVTAQLIDAASGYQLWSARYDRAMDDVFAVQDEIAAAIVGTLKVRLTAGDSARPAQRVNVQAHEAYLKSRYHFSKLTPQRLALSQAYAEEAIRFDPEYPAAQAQLAECFIQTALYGARPAREMVPLAREAALKAVSLDASEPSAHMTLARIAGEYDLDWPKALRHCRLALGSDRITPAVRALCAQYVLWPLGRIDELIEAVGPAFDLDPLSPMPRIVLAQAHLARGARDHSLAEIRSVLELHEHFWPGYLAEGFIHALENRTADAIAALEKSYAIAPWDPVAAGFLAGLRENGPPDHMGPLGLSSYYFVIGDFDGVAKWHEAVIDARYPVAAYYFTWMCLSEPFRESPQGQALRAMLRTSR